eukprot:379942-Amphidinium_carterae.1
MKFELPVTECCSCGLQDMASGQRHAPASAFDPQQELQNNCNAPIGQHTKTKSTSILHRPQEVLFELLQAGSGDLLALEGSEQARLRATAGTLQNLLKPAYSVASFLRHLDHTSWADLSSP